MYHNNPVVNHINRLIDSVWCMEQLYPVHNQFMPHYWPCTITSLQLATILFLVLVTSLHLAIMWAMCPLCQLFYKFVTQLCYLVTILKVTSFHSSYIRIYALCNEIINYLFYRSQTDHSVAPSRAPSYPHILTHFTY